MFSYTKSAVLSNNTTYQKNASGSNSQSNASDGATTTSEEQGGGGTTIFDNGSEINSNSGANHFESWFAGEDYGGDTYRNGGKNAGGTTVNVKRETSLTYSNSISIFQNYTNVRTLEYTGTESGAAFYGSTSWSQMNVWGATGITRGDDDNTDSGTYSFSTSGTYETSFTRQIQTSTTTTYEYYPAATTQTTFYNKKGTTTTAGTITFPTTTETSWTEIAITNSTKTKTSTVVTTTSEASHRSAITAHTVIHVAAGETLYTLNQSPNIGTPFSGTENWQSIEGPDTITISRWPCATYQCAVLDASAEPFDSNATETSSTKTITEMNGVETTNVTSFYKTTEGLPLGSTSFEGAGSIIKTTSETYVVVSYLAPTTATSQRVAVTQTATHNVSIGGVAFPVNGKAETANVIVVVPFVRSANNSGSFSDSDEGVSGGGADGFTEAGNFFVAHGVHNFPNNGGISDAYLRRAYAWATVGDGTSATAEPKQSWTINGVSKVTWEAVSVSDGVATPWPVFGVETTSTTQSGAGTTSTATATTAIWGNVYRRTSSSSNSSGVTTSVETTQLSAGGNGHTMLELGGLPALPTPAYIPSPVGSVLPVFGAAHIDDKRTVIIMPAEYANTTVTAPKTYSGSTLPETYFETKSLQVVLEGQGGAVQRLKRL